MTRLLAHLSLVLFVCGAAHGQVATGIRLYTKPDPLAGGGIRGRIGSPGQPLTGVFALPPSEPGRVYKAVLGPDKRTFELNGLPAGKYDLLVVFANRAFEGLTLERRVDTLTDEDREGIEDIISRSEPYFNEKHVHRVSGTTGHMTGMARSICTFLRSKSSIGHLDGIVRKEHRRSLKLVLLEHVGPGWQVAKTREVFTVMVPPGTGRTVVQYRRQLRGIRVTDAVRDLGELDLKTE
jgi:hypothetical protein